MNKITVADYLIQELSRLGIKDFFGIPGDYNFNLLEAVQNNSETNWVVGCSNELNAGYAADGYARINGYGALITTYSVGELSAINAIAGSFAENVPVISVVGLPKTKFIRNNTLIHHNFTQPNYYSNFDAYSNVVQARAFLNEDNAKEEIDRLISIFIKEKKPVYIAIPEDICLMYIDNSPKINETKTDTKKLEKVVEHILKIIKKSKNPVILGDILIDRFKSKCEFKQLVKNSGFPSTTLVMGNGLVDESEPNFIGTYLGTLDNINVYNTVNESDCVISVGTVFSDFNTMQFDIRFRASDFVEIQGHYTIVECKIYENILMKDVLNALSERIPYRRLKVLRDRPELCSTHIDKEKNLDYDYMMARIQEFLKPNDCIFAETGTFSFAVPSINFPDNCTLFVQMLWGSIGWATPAVFGAMMADKSKRMILLTGEGSHQQTFQAVSNMLNKKLKPVIIVLNNSGYSIERAISNHPADPYNDIVPWDYAKLIDSFEGDVWTAKAFTNTDLNNILQQAEIENADKLCYIEAFTDKFDYPPLMRKISARKKMRENNN